jgi:transmembrane sensor
MTHPEELLEENGPQDTAAAWFARWRSGQMTAAQIEDAEAWLRSVPENREAFEDIAAVWDAMEPARRDPAIMDLRGKAKRRGRRNRLWLQLRVAAAVIIVVAVGFGGFRWTRSAAGGQPVEYATRIGQTSTVILADGSKVILDADSALKVWPHMVAERRLELVRGRAFFEVAKDRRRPFIVRTDKGSVTALGTAFDVRRNAAGMKIVLLEGRVQIRPSAKAPSSKPLEMAAGYEFIGDGAAWQLTKTDSEAETSWIRGDLIFDDQPLSAIVEELNRYDPEKIVIGDPEVGRRRLSAVLKAGDSKLFLASVQTLKLASVKRSSENEVMLVPPQ